MKALPHLRRWWNAPFVRTAVWGALGLAAVTLGILLAYELALARVPQHRAALERLVRAQTGLDVRFNELNLHWGWYGPEAVFHRVELNEPGRANVLLRAPQLIVGLDAWSSVRTGQLQAGRITLMAPDIDLQRRADARPAADPAAARDSGAPYQLRLLQHWRGGRVEIEGGLLRLSDPANPVDALPLQIRQATLRHSGGQWSASALVFLPDRLGHTVRLAAQLQGELTRPRDLSGAVRFDGLRLAFAGWRRILAPLPALARQLPAAGSGDVVFRVNFARGALQKADGRVHAQEVLFAAQEGGRGALTLKRLAGEWRLAQRGDGWQLRVAALDLGGDGAPADLAVDVAAHGDQAQGTLGRTPLESLAALMGWIAPEIDLNGSELTGTVRDLRFDWRRARPEGERLKLAARGENLSFAPPSRDFTLAGANAAFAASEDHLDIALDTEHGRLALARAPQHPFEDLRIVSQLRLTLSHGGWHLNTPLLTLDDGDTQLILSGSLTRDSPTRNPQLDLRATLTHAEVPLLRALLDGEEAAQRFGPMVAQLTGGHIERGQWRLETALETQPQLFSGSLTLRGGELTAGDLSPPVQDVDAQVDWTGPRVRADIGRARCGSIQIQGGMLTLEQGRLQSATLTADWAGVPLTLRVAERGGRNGPSLVVRGHGTIDAQKLIELAGLTASPDVTGQTPWTGELRYQSPRGHPARWQLDADASLIGVGSRLPEPLAKTTVTAMPLHIAASGSATQAQVRLTLAGRLHSRIALVRQPPETDWHIERGAVHFLAMQGKVDARIVAHLQDSWKNPLVVVN